MPNANHLEYREQRSILSGLLPFLVFVSTLWLNLYVSFSMVSLANFEGSKSVLLGILLSGIFYYAIFELLFLIYRFLIGFSIYSFMIPRRALKDKFRFWYMIRNFALGIFFNLRFFFPYIGTYLCILDMVFSFLFLIFFNFSIQRTYVEPMVGQFVFKTLSVPILIYEAYLVIKLLVGVL